MSAESTIITPCYTIDLRKVRENLRKFQSAGFDVAYSVKANADTEIIRTINESGGCFEVSSYWEYEKVSKCGVSPNSIIANLCNATSRELRELIHSGVLVVVDSVELLDLVCALRQRCSIGLRINLDHIKISSQFKKKTSRFGLLLNDGWCDRISTDSNVRVSCLQCHCSGNTRAPVVYARIAGELASVARKFPTVERIDVGGGFKTDIWSPEEYFTSITGSLPMGHSFRILIEPGNSIVRDACGYRTRIIGVRYGCNGAVARVDGSFLHIGKRTVSAEDLYIDSANCSDRRVTIVGATCKESDVLASEVCCGPMRIGDEVLIKNVGAYCMDEFGEFLMSAPSKYYMY